VTFALGLSSFIYYNYIGIRENGLFGHLEHFAGPIWWIAPLIFSVELISNLIRPFTLGIRLFANMFADEKVLDTIAHLVPGVTYWLVPILLMPLSLFVAFIQTFVFVLLSQLYLSEVSHGPHDGQVGHGHAECETESSGFRKSGQGEIRDEKTKNARFRRARGLDGGDNGRGPACYNRG